MGDCGLQGLLGQAGHCFNFPAMPSLKLAGILSYTELSKYFSGFKLQILKKSIYGTDENLKHKIIQIKLSFLGYKNIFYQQFFLV